jgi:large subunit ribosomal protein L9
MKIVLLERVENLGVIGDVVTVRPGYARNWLLPQGKALRATDTNLRRFAVQRAEIERRNAETREAAAQSGERLEGQSFILLRQAGDSGQLYGSVSARDVADAAQAAGFSVPRASVVLDKPIKTIGLYPLKVRLHPEVSVSISVNVARSAEEAERQAKGEDVVAAAMAAERELASSQAAEIAANAAALDLGPRDD